jgi:osmotically-inducible protein OsmY
MRRKYFGLAIAAFATLGPLQAWGGDREIAEQIISRLKSNRDSGALKDFTLDLKVDGGVVLFKGNVGQASQKELVLKAAEGIEGVSKVVDEVTVAGAKAEAKSETKPGFSFRQTLAAQAEAIRGQSADVESSVAQTASPVMPGAIQRTAAEEPTSESAPTSDNELVSAVVAALSQAKDAGELRGFGIDVKSQNGVLQLTGRASSSAQRDTIIRIAESVPGVAGVREAIAIPTAAPNLPRLPEPPALNEVQSQLTPVAVDPISHPTRSSVPATVASAPVGMPAFATPYRTQGGGVPAQAVSQMGTPVPMAPHAPVGAPRYDSPNLPNYAWPGYAAYPNYAALTYPQQYSPSAWPYIGPFYPYPQVPLGWRKVTLEWDDGWWFLDFTSK